jgi:hypothetical protein
MSVAHIASKCMSHDEENLHRVLLARLRAVPSTKRIQIQRRLAWPLRKDDL